MFLKPNSLAVSQSQESVVVHNRVHVFNPESVHVTIEHDVLALVLVRWFVNLTEDTGQQTIRPVSCDWVQCTVQLHHCASLGVHHVQFSGDTKAAGNSGSMELADGRKQFTVEGDSGRETGRKAGEMLRKAEERKATRHGISEKAQSGR